jgi:hypothetical protein
MEMMEDDQAMIEDDLGVMEDDLECMEDDLECMEDDHKWCNFNKLYLLTWTSDVEVSYHLGNQSVSEKSR